MNWRRWLAIDPDEEDRRLIARMTVGGKAGQQAWDHLYRRYQVRFERYLWKRGLPLAKVEDVIQDTWIEIAKKANEYKRDKKPAHWLLAFLENVAIRELDTRAKGKETVSLWREDDEGNVIDELLADPASAPQERDRQRDLTDCVDAGFTRFKSERPNEAQALRLCLLQELTIEEVARIRGCTAGAARQYLSSLRRLVRPFLEHCREFLHGGRDG